MFKDIIYVPILLSSYYNSMYYAVLCSTKTFMLS